MTQTRYTKDHEWAKLEHKLVTVGITDFAQSELGDLVFIQLPTIGKTVLKGDEAAVIESVKAAGEVKSPVGGSITEINEALVDAPEKVNEDPMGEGWFYKVTMSNSSEWEHLLDETEYAALVAKSS
jgi:glycine cleavage system H protein